MEFDFEGAGDGTKYDAPWSTKDEDDATCYVKKTLSNGLPVPVYPTANSGDDEDDEQTLTTFYTSRSHNIRNMQTKSPVKQSRTSSYLKEGNNKPNGVSWFMKEYLSCPICEDVFIEATNTNCGHKFCKNCIELWRTRKSLCPVCSALITSIHRSYSDDQMIESQLENLSPELKARYLSAQNKRLDTILSERKSRTVVKKIRKKLDDSVVYLRSKNGALSTVKGFGMSLLSIVKKTNFGLLSGILIGVMLMFLANYLKNLEVPQPSVNFNFARYAWLAAKRYDGSIPEEWQEPGVAEKGAAPTDHDQSFVYKLLSSIYLNH